MSDISALTERINSALERLGQGFERLAEAAAPAPAADDTAARLREELEVERTTNAQLTERLKTLKDRDAQSVGQLEERIAVLTKQLDVQGLEMQKLRKTTVQLREQLRSLRETATVPDAHMINKVMLTELEALRAARASETAEIGEILSELAPLLQEVKTDA